MAKKLSKEQLEQMKKDMERFMESSKLEGIEFSQQQLAMFDMFNERGWTTDQCIEFVKEYYGYGKRE